MSGKVIWFIGVTRRGFIITGIEAGKLEYREGCIWGNPYLRILRSQLEKYIAEQLGFEYLRKVKNQAELRKIKKEIGELNKRLDTLQRTKAALEAALKKCQTTEKGNASDPSTRCACSGPLTSLGISTKRRSRIEN